MRKDTKNPAKRRNVVDAGNATVPTFPDCAAKPFEDSQVSAVVIVVATVVALDSSEKIEEFAEHKDPSTIVSERC